MVVAFMHANLNVVSRFRVCESVLRARVRTTDIIEHSFSRVKSKIGGHESQRSRRREVREVRKMLRVTAIPVLLLLSLLVVEALVVQPVFADSAGATPPTDVKYKGKGVAYQTDIEVVNDGNDTQPIYDFHVSVNTTILAVGKPKGWRAKWLLKPSSLKWETGDRRAILNGGSQAGFKIVTTDKKFKVSWWTTDKNGATIDSGSFMVP